MSADKSNEHENSSRSYLEKHADLYILDGSSGIYKPKTEPTQKTRQQDSPGSDKQRPFWVSIVRDWPVLLVSVATSLLLVATVYYTRKQWLAADQSASATLTAANAAKDSVKVASDTLQHTKDQEIAQAPIDKASREKSQQSAERSARLAQKSIQATIDNFRRQQRPWITIESIEPVDLQGMSLYSGYHGVGVLDRASAKLSNTGLSPAIEVVFDSKGVNFDTQEQWPESAVLDFCKTLTMHKTQRFSIFPGESTFRDQGAMIPDERTEDGRLGIFLPGIIACVVYRSTVDGEWHYTGRVYKIDKKPLIGSMYGVFNKSQLPLPADKLVIENMPFPDAVK